jgi:hypothetical protein
MHPSFGGGRAALVDRPCAIQDALPSMSEIAHPATQRMSEMPKSSAGGDGTADSFRGLPVVAQFITEKGGDDALILTVVGVEPRLRDSQYPAVHLLGRRTNERRFMLTF